MSDSPEGKNFDVQKMTSRLLKGVRDGFVEDSTKSSNVTSSQSYFNEEDDFTPSSTATEIISGNGKNSTPPYGIERPAGSLRSSMVSQRVEDPPTVVHSYMFTEALRVHIDRTISSITRDKELIEDVFVKLAATDLEGGNREGLLSLVSFSVHRRLDSVKVSEQVLRDLVGNNLNVDTNLLTAGLHNYFDPVGLIFQIAMEEGNIFSKKRVESVTLALNVPKI